MKQWNQRLFPLSDQECPYDVAGIQKRIVNSHIRLAVKDREEILSLREKLLRCERDNFELRQKLAEVTGRRDVSI